MLQRSDYRPRFPRLSAQENYLFSAIYAEMVSLDGLDEAHPGALDAIDAAAATIVVAPDESSAIHMIRQHLCRARMVAAMMERN